MDKKSVLVGILIGVLIGGSVSVLLTIGYQDSLEEHFTLRIRIDPSYWYNFGSLRTIHESGVIAVFIRNNITITERLIGDSYENVTLPKGAYIVNLYHGASGEFIEKIDLYLIKDIEYSIKF